MKRILFLVLAALIAAFCGTAYSSTATDVLNVSTTIIPTCSVSTMAVDFGSHDSSTYVFANGDVTVTCASGAPYNIALDAGQNYNGYRRVSSGLDYIDYILIDGVSGAEWGDSDFANTFPGAASVADTGNGSAQPHTVRGILNYGPIPSGLYADIVTVTVHY